MTKFRVQYPKYKVSALLVLSLFVIGHSASAQQADEVFVPQSQITSGSGTLEFRGDTTIVGGDIKLKQICRWSDTNAHTFTPVADLIVDRLQKNQANKRINLEDLRKTLGEAGLNMAVIRFSGAMSCTVNRADIAGGDRTALAQWVEEKTGKPVDSSTTDHPAVAEPALSAAVLHPDEKKNAPVTVPVTVIALRDKLVSDVSQRLNIPLEQLQVTFSPKDANLLNLAEPAFKFEITPDRVRDLGKVSWTVAILAGGGQQKVTITAEARAWQEQAVTSRSLAYKEVIRDEDVSTQKVLVDHINEVPILPKDKIVGQQASRDLSPSTVVTSRMVESVPLAKPGQYITVTCTFGTVQMKSVAKAMEMGSYGQTIRVRNDATRETLDVTLTGPQTATLNAN